MSTTTETVSATTPEDSRPMLTLDGRALLEDRAARLREDRVPALRAAIVDGATDGSAHLDLERALWELDALEEALDVAGLVPVAKSDVLTVELGDLVMVEFPGARGEARVESFRVVHPIEAPLTAERISVGSPLARALLGAQVGHMVTVDAPARRHHLRVLTAVRPTLPPGSRAASGGPAHAWRTSEEQGQPGQPMSRAPSTAA